MANQKIVNLTELTSAPATGDVTYIVDVSDTTDDASGTSKKITIQTLDNRLASLSQTLTNKTIDADNNTISNLQHGSEVDNLITSHGATGAVVGTTNSQTLTNKIFTLPQINDTSSDHQYIFGVSELTADRTITLPLLTGNDEFVFKNHIQTFTNKRITKRVKTITSNATPTVNTDNSDVVTITALALAITSMTTNLSGTPTNFQTLIYRILDDGSNRAITWGAKFQAMGVALPTTTAASKVLTVGFIYDTVDAKWGCVASVEEA